ncbi:MAG: uracil-DNA glycosylase [Anaerolineae bacterium]|nr:uracil-DNA glycosylase [Anaerolineae bacterium]
MSFEERTTELDAIAAAVRACVKCQLHKGRTKAVPGAGPYNADIMFIGEGPGYHEDQQGLPFVGASGKLLEEMLGKIGLKRDQVFITNVVKCRPPENRDPLPVEIETCTGNYLFRQIELIDPKVIVTLGRFSMGLFFPGAKISQIHGKAKWEKGRAYLPMFHPAAVLRSLESMKPQYEVDFRKLPELVEQAKKDAKPAPSAPPTPETPKKDDDPPSGSSTPPKQLSLF